MNYLNRVKFATATTGTGTLTVGTAEAGFRTPAQAGAVDGQVYRYKIEDTGDAWEIGYGTYTASGTTLSRTVLQSTDSDEALDLSGSAVVAFVAVAEDMAENAYYQYLAATLEPDAIEKFNTGTFTYTVGGSETKLLMACWKLQIGGAGRFELRDTSKFLPLRDVAITGLAATSFAIVVDPTLPTYANAREKYFDRLVAISQLKTKFAAITAASGGTPFIFLPGPYGSIVTSLTTHNLAWAGVYLPNTGAIPMQPEIDDTDAFRIANPMHFAVSKKFCNGLITGAARSDADGTGSGGVTFVTLPATWSVITDATSYDFRDDFMGATLDTVTDWTRAESTAGNVEINTNFQWLKLVGNTNWGTNGCFSQASISRANGKVFMCDLWIPSTSNHALIVGFHDGAGQSYTDFAHGLHFGGAGNINAYEAGSDRGVVGSWTAGMIYRVRITLGASNNATYEIQGGAFDPIGGATWDNITPGTSSNSTTPLHAGASMYQGTGYVSDVKVY